MPITGSESSETPPGELRRLSAADTDFRKVWVMGFGTLWMVGASLAAVFGGAPILFPLAGMIVLGIAGWQALRLKVVETDGYTLLVSTSSKTMHVPLTWVESVESGSWPLDRNVTVTFREDTPFGRKIVFAPRGRWGWLWGR